MSELIRLEFHCHTTWSKDSLTQIPSLLAICKKRNIDRLVITDHNTIRGALIAKGIDPERVIVGEEIMTQQGELLAAFVKEEVPPGLPADVVIQILSEQNAFISVSHPFDKIRSGHWKRADLLDVHPHLDAIEVFNSRCFPPYYNEEARKFADQFGISSTVGSDAHTLWEVGRATMQLPNFSGADGLRKSIQMATNNCKITPPWIRISSRYAVLYKKLRSGKAKP